MINNMYGDNVNCVVAISQITVIIRAVVASESNSWAICIIRGNMEVMSE